VQVNKMVELLLNNTSDTTSLHSSPSGVSQQVLATKVQLHTQRAFDALWVSRPCFHARKGVNFLSLLIADAPAGGWPQSELVSPPQEEEHDGPMMRRDSVVDQSRSSGEVSDLMFEDIDFTKDSPYIVLMRTLDVLIQGNMPPVKHVSGFICCVHFVPFAFITTIVSTFTRATVGLTPNPCPACGTQLSSLHMWLSTPDQLHLPLALLPNRTSLSDGHRAGGISDQVRAMSRTRRSLAPRQDPSRCVLSAQRSIPLRRRVEVDRGCALSHASAHA
jgi:hypothetical protein